MPKEKLREAAKLAEVERIEEAFYNGVKTVGNEDESSQGNASVEGIDITQTKISFRKADALAQPRYVVSADEDIKVDEAKNQLRTDDTG